MQILKNINWNNLVYFFKHVKIGSTLEHEMDKELQKQKLEQLWDFWSVRRVFKTLTRSNLLMPKLFQNHSITIGQSGQIVLSTLDLVDKKKFHCRTKWQHKVEWIRLVKNLNSCSLQEITKDLRKKVLNLWSLKHIVVLRMKISSW